MLCAESNKRETIAPPPASPLPPAPGAQGANGANLLFRYHYTVDWPRYMDQTLWPSPVRALLALLPALRFFIIF